MRKLENAWFKEVSCQDSYANISFSNSLGLESFWGLFLIAGVASLLALLIFVVSFLHQHKHIWLNNDQSASIWRIIRVLARIFDQRDVDCHIFKKRGNENGNISPRDVDLEADESETSPGRDCAPSPSSQAESNVPIDDEDFCQNTEMNAVQIAIQEGASENNCEINSLET